MFCTPYDSVLQHLGAVLFLDVVTHTHTHACKLHCMNSVGKYGKESINGECVIGLNRPLLPTGVNTWDIALVLMNAGR